MKVYIAASYMRRAEMLVYANSLTADGHKITSEWVTGIHEKPPWTETLFALDDIRSIKNCDALLSFTEESSAPPTYKRGGRHVEFGVGWAMNKILILVGPRENSFHHLPGVIQLDTFDAARLCLRFLGGCDTLGREEVGASVQE